MKKLLLLALIPLIGINRLQASFKDFYDRLLSYTSPVQTAVVAASVVTLHGVGYLCGLKARKWYEVKKANQSQPTVVQQERVKVPELTEDQKKQFLTLSPEAKQQLENMVIRQDKAIVTKLLHRFEFGYEDEEDKDTADYLMKKGWSWALNPITKKYVVYHTDALNNKRRYDCQMRDYKYALTLQIEADKKQKSQANQNLIMTHRTNAKSFGLKDLVSN